MAPTRRSRLGWPPARGGRVEGSQQSATIAVGLSAMPQSDSIRQKAATGNRHVFRVRTHCLSHGLGYLPASSRGRRGRSRRGDTVEGPGRRKRGCRRCDRRCRRAHRRADISNAPDHPGTLDRPGRRRRPGSDGHTSGDAGRGPSRSSTTGRFSSPGGGEPFTAAVAPRPTRPASRSRRRARHRSPRRRDPAAER